MHDLDFSLCKRIVSMKNHMFLGHKSSNGPAFIFPVAPRRDGLSERGISSESAKIKMR